MICKVIQELSASSHPNHAIGVYIINSAGIVYHQCGALYIIKPQADTRWRVMRYKGGLPPLMICTALRAV
ncbi:MAG: hypothetical protein IJX70_04500, partial [Clostridia bacterium]|nr:hypothetical protein [Clostridia bacterium]